MKVKGQRTSEVATMVFHLFGHNYQKFLKKFLGRILRISALLRFGSDLRWAWAQSIPLFSLLSGPSRFSILHQGEIFGIDEIIAAQLRCRQASGFN
jgi:hypothetical protein